MTTSRLTLTNGLAVAALCVLSVASTLQMQALAKQNAIDGELRDRALSLTPSTASNPSADPFQLRPLLIQAATADGTLVGRSANLGDRRLPLSYADLQQALLGNAGYDEVDIDGHRLRSYFAPLRASELPVDANIIGVVQVASPTDELYVSVPLTWLALSAVIGASAAIGTGWLLARIALAPVEKLATTVRAINSTDDLEIRVPLQGFRSRSVLLRLAEDVNSMLERLLIATRKLEAALNAQRQFVADASHELRTPLTALRGNVQLLVRLIGGNANAIKAEHQAILSDMAEDTQRMSRLVDELLLLAQADADQHLELIPVELSPLLRNAVRAARSLTPEIDIQADDLGSGTWLLADMDRLQQLVLILLDNAIKYTPPNGTVTLDSAPTESAGRSGVEIIVTDSGIGIPVGERERIFERFYRSPAARRQADGAGLGLAVARWIAHEHHGEITVRDAAPVGSVFAIWLPTIPPSDQMSAQFTAI
jgi:two-component system, OmpR family, sensor kinase